MNPKINGLMAEAVRRVLRGAVKRPTRQGAPSCESLEGRVVLSNWGGADLLGGLSQIGVVTTVLDAGGPRGGLTLSTPAAGQTSQADTDWQTLQTKIQGLAAKSAVTVADLSALASDSQAIATAGGGLKAESLKTVLGNLATAVAGGADTAQAQTDFNALFSGSKVDQATIDKTFTDLVQTIKDSKITTTDLTDFATAQAALPISAIPMNGPGFAVAPGGFHGAGPQGDALTVSLANAGVLALPAGQQTAAARPAVPAGGIQVNQLQTDLATLRSDLKTVTAKSSVTSDDLVQLKTDFQDITTAGLKIDPKSLQSAINGLVAAVAGGADTTQAQADFNTLFSGSNISQTVIDKTFADLVQTIQDSNITSDGATLIATDQAAVQAAFDALPQGGVFIGPGGQGGFATLSQGGPGAAFISRGGAGGGFVAQGGGMAGPDGQGGFAASTHGGGFVAQGGGMVGGQTSLSDPGTVTSGNPGAPTGMDSGSATIAPAGASGAVDSTAVNGPGTSTVNTYAVSESGGDRARGGIRGRFVRSLGGRFGRNATGASEGGVQGLASGMARQGRVMNRFRGR